MNTSSRRLTSVLAALAASVLAGSVALADGRGQGGGGPSFSSGRGGGGSYSGSRGGSFAGHQGGRSMSSERGGGWGGTRSYSSPRSGGSFSSGDRGSFRSGGSFSSSRDFSSGRNFGGSMRVPSRPDFNSSNGFDRPYNGVRIPDATRPGYSPGEHPRAGFSTTRPDLGVTRNFDDRARIDRGDRPSFRTTRPDFNGRVDRPSFDGRGSFSTRPDRGSTVRSDFYRPPLSGRDGFASRPGFYSPSFGRHRHWGGGYWNGIWWPRAYYRSSFVTFWPVLPFGCETFWWGGRNYYFYDNVYYTWSPVRYGYVVTDPPPAVAYGSSDSGSAAVESEDSSDGSPASVYVYPRNGQSEEQTANDRYECHKWAVEQTGYDPTTATPETQSSPSADDDYRRALIACLDARGYSAK